MRTKLSTLIFIERSKKLWGENTWDYSKCNYMGRREKLTLICREHKHEFEQLADGHIKLKNGCFYCTKHTMNTKKFIMLSKELWGDDVFDYSKTEYVNPQDKMIIICKEHNQEFEQTSTGNLHKNKGCLYCSNGKSNTEKFINKSKEIFGNDKFNYSKTEYINNNSKIKIICNKHDYEFEQMPENHLRGRNNCKYCISKTTEEFILESKEIWGNDRYDYSKVNYEKCSKKIEIRCIKHNHIFMQRPSSHIQKADGCKYCNGLSMSTEDFISKANEVHNNMYNYTKTKYIKATLKVEIICNKHNHTFFQTPNNHLRGNGCPICKISLGEKMIIKILESLNIEYIREKYFNDCRNISYLFFDFYLPKYNTCIEFDGIQHYEPVERFGGLEGFESSKIRDNIKNEYCIDKNIGLLRIKYTEKEIVSLTEKIKLFLNI